MRIGDALPEILENLAAFRRLRDERPSSPPPRDRLRRDEAEHRGASAVVRLGREAGMDRLLVTNVLAYTDDLKDEVLYDEGLAPGDGDTPERPAILLPRLEPSEPSDGRSRGDRGGPADVRPGSPSRGAGTSAPSSSAARPPFAGTGP